MMWFQLTQGNNKILFSDSCSIPIKKIKLYAPIDFENKLHKKWVENCLLGFDLGLSTWVSSYNHQTTLRWYQGNLKILYTHSQSLGITKETFHFPESVQMFLNPWNQPLLTLSSTSTLHTLNYTTPLEEGLRRSFTPLGLHKEILSSPHLFILWLTPETKTRQNLGFT